ncbi:hypothetical protein BKA56DRAFT_679811 [Ilyonectria sp. MPI-CAGE-AT-0026]|nr:hypothetical protein BKA56DRAFT_679811 [Ilyonectria sp. MPI-CAGE-AT-0026]
MKASAWLVILALVKAIYAQTYGFWVTGLDDNLWEVCQALNLSEYEEIRELNSVGDVRSVDPGRTYMIPYTTAVAPATSSKDRSQFLYFNKQERTISLDRMVAAAEATTLPTQKLLPL